MTMFKNKIKYKGKDMRVSDDALQAIVGARAVSNQTVSVQQPIDKKETKFKEVLLNVEDLS